jgi:predicted Zn-dependent protease
MRDYTDSVLDEAHRIVERRPTDLLSRYTLGALLCERHEYREAIAELQKARANPSCRRRAMLLLVQAYKAVGLRYLAERERDALESEGGESPRGDGPPTAPKPAPLSPITPLNAKEVKELPG